MAPFWCCYALLHLGGTGTRVPRVLTTKLPAPLSCGWLHCYRRRSSTPWTTSLTSSWRSGPPISSQVREFTFDRCFSLRGGKSTCQVWWSLYRYWEIKLFFFVVSVCNSITGLVSLQTSCYLELRFSAPWKLWLWHVLEWRSAENGKNTLSFSCVCALGNVVSSVLNEKTENALIFIDPIWQEVLAEIIKDRIKSQETCRHSGSASVQKCHHL